VREALQGFGADVKQYCTSGIKFHVHIGGPLLSTPGYGLCANIRLYLGPTDPLALSRTRRKKTFVF
jgi:hypothetical protein